MTCKSCGSNDIINENYHQICSSCGYLMDNSFLDEANLQSIQSSSFASFQDKYNGRAYYMFKRLYHSCSLTLNTPNSVKNEGLTLLPKLWDNTKLKHMKNKKVVIFALLFLLYRSHNIPMIGTYFQSKAMINCSRFGKSITFVKRLFDFPSSLDVDLLGMIKSKTQELAAHIFKKSSPSLEKTATGFGLRLAQVIHEKEWGNQQSKLYVSFIASAAIIISAQYAVIAHNNEKKHTLKRHATFRVTQKGTLNYQKVADKVFLHVRIVQNFLKKIQDELFKIAKKIPWKPTFVTSSNQVGLILSDILDYMELDVKEESDAVKADQVTSTDSTHQKAVIICISKFLHSAEMQDVDWEKEGGLMKENQFLEMLQSELLKSFSKEEKHDTGSLQISVEKDYLKIGECYYDQGFFTVVTDLLKANCPLSEILSEDYVELVQKYLDWDKESTDNEELEPLSNEESFMYLRDVDLDSE